MSGDAAINLPAMTAEAERLTNALGRMKDPYGVQQLTKQIDSSADDEARVKSMVEEVDRLEEELEILQQLNEARGELKEITKRFEELNVPMQYDISVQMKLWEKCMGLRFRVTEDKAISLAFTRINSAAPEERFVVTVDIKEDGNWTVVNLEPGIHGVGPLLEELNRTSNLGRFCKEVRKKFKEHSAASQAQGSQTTTE